MSGAPRATTPRPYGVGPYGTGPYSVYAGQLWDAGCAAHMVTTARASPQWVYRFASAPRISFTARAMAQRVYSIGSLTALEFSTAAMLAYVRVAGGGAVEITFGAWAVLNETWTDTPCCEVGAWAPVLPP